jgi:drug/metabolite transporter (DMT)-like permease
MSGSRFSNQQLSVIAIVFLSIVWGTTHVAVKFAIQTIPVFFMAGIRELLAGSIFLAFSYFREKQDRINWPEILRQGLFGLGFFTSARGLMVLGLDYAPAGLVSLVFSLIPVYVLLINALFGRGFVNRQIIIGLLLGGLGMLLVFRESLLELEGWEAIIGMGIALGGAFCWAGTSVLLTDGRDGDLPPLFRSGVQLIFGALGLLLISGVTLEPVDILSFSLTSVLAVLYLVVFGSILAFGSYVFAIKHLPVAQVTIYAYFNPFVALFLGWLLLGELLSTELVLSFGVTLLGVYVLNRGYKR